MMRAVRNQSAAKSPTGNHAAELNFEKWVDYRGGRPKSDESKNSGSSSNGGAVRRGGISSAKRLGARSTPVLRDRLAGKERGPRKRNRSAAVVDGGNFVSPVSSALPHDYRLPGSGAEWAAGPALGSRCR